MHNRTGSGRLDVSEQNVCVHVPEQDSPRHVQSHAVLEHDLQFLQGASVRFLATWVSLNSHSGPEDLQSCNVGIFYAGTHCAHERTRGPALFEGLSLRLLHEQIKRSLTRLCLSSIVRLA